MPSLAMKQERTVERMLEVRSSEKRAAKNRTAALRQYYDDALKLGYTRDEVLAQVRDIRDVYALRRDARDEL